MANREALRELQTRLATRLQAARSEGMSVAWLAVLAGGRNYLLPLGQSGEIFPTANVQAVPYARKWLRGVLNIRGGLFGIVDFAGFVAEDGGAARTQAAAVDTSVVTLHPALEVNCALQVDTLAGLRGPESFASSTAPTEQAPAYFGNCLVDATGQAWQEINLRVLSQSPQFLSISA